MANNTALKMKMLILWELLRQDSDKGNPLTTNEICKRLGEAGIPCDRKTVYTDIDLLNQSGFEVRKTTVGKQNGYYVENRAFNAPELKIMIDALQAASFITERKTKELTDKVADLGGSHRAEILKSSLVRFNTRKHSNEGVIKNIDMLERALLAKTKAFFLYFDLDENHQRVYRKNKEFYTVDPVALVFVEDNYYLMTWSEKYEQIVTYRVDRMEGVGILPQQVCKAARMSEKKIAQFTDETFKMFGGQTETVTLCFDDCLIGSVYDKFGEKTKITRIDEHTCTTTVAVQMSPTFTGWLSQFGEKMTIA